MAGGIRTRWPPCGQATLVLRTCWCVDQIALAISTPDWLAGSLANLEAARAVALSIFGRHWEGHVLEIYDRLLAARDASREDEGGK